jgi:FixJ family two-component response regulator
MRLYPVLTVQVVVPDSELRRSIAFALEAEGYAIEQHVQLADAIGASTRPGVVCTVVDENALAGRSAQGLIPQGAHSPLVLLVDKMRTTAASSGLKVLTKPLLGHLLVETIDELVPSRLISNATT